LAKDESQERVGDADRKGEHGQASQHAHRVREEAVRFAGRRGRTDKKSIHGDTQRRKSGTQTDVQWSTFVEVNKTMEKEVKRKLFWPFLYKRTNESSGSVAMESGPTSRQSWGSTTVRVFSEQAANRPAS
jgi:hypothetical protein